MGKFDREREVVGRIIATYEGELDAKREALDQFVATYVDPLRVEISALEETVAALRAACGSLPQTMELRRVV